jgi:broad specificity phosphatase PhoE
MKLIFVRHCDPDYEKDSLTPKGWKEAELLADRLTKLDVRDFYCSPLGRAKDTASVTLKRLHRDATVFDWLQEFPARILDPESGERTIAWDLMPAYWTKRVDLYNKDKWYLDPIMKSGNTEKIYRGVADGIDSVLDTYGYRRDGMFYRTEGGNEDAIVFFCHLGVELVMLSHLLGISAPALWQGFFVAPSSVTILSTEERKKGEVSFRCKALGDTSHLYVGNEPISNSGFFQEMWK